MQHNRPKHVICILGMHRSGTSCLTGSLQECGLTLGQHHTWNPYNLKGNRENQDIVDLHDKLLSDNNGSWDQPPKKVIWQQTHYDQAKAILKDHAGEVFWGFKDPRCLLAYEGWLTLCPDIHFIGVFRNPTAVALSLDNRGGHSPQNAYQIWRRYNKRLLALHKQRPFPLLNFDWESDVFKQRVEKYAREIGLNPDQADGSFYSEQLKSDHAIDTQKMPWALNLTYKKLIEISNRYDND